MSVQRRGQGDSPVSAPRGTAPPNTGRAQLLPMPPSPCTGGWEGQTPACCPPGMAGMAAVTPTTNPCVL